MSARDTAPEVPISDIRKFARLPDGTSSASCRHARNAGNTRRRNATITIERHPHAMIGLRVVLIALGAALGLVLLSQGFIVIGGLILAMTIVGLSWCSDGELECPSIRPAVTRFELTCKAAGSNLAVWDAAQT